jgi:hypothetical protein
MLNVALAAALFQFLSPSSARSDQLTCSEAVGGVVLSAFCIPFNYSRHDRPTMEAAADDDNPMFVSTGFIIDDVSDIDDKSCEVTLVLIMKLSWTEERLV